MKKVKLLQSRRRTATSTDETYRIDAQVCELNEHISYGEHHQKRRDIQRKATQDTRDGLQPHGQSMLIFVDYVSYYLASGAKQNTLVFEVETRDGGDSDGRGGICFS